jgi:outer membrane protein assembly factor BamB
LESDGNGNIFVATYNSGGDLFNSSPTVSEANEVYIVGSLIYKVHGNTGSLFPNYPIIPNGGFRPANFADSVALSTCGGQPCLIVSGEYPSMGIGAVQAYNSVTTAQLWTGRFFDTPITASPVVSESQGLVYVQGAGSLEAVDLATGVYNWLASFPGTNASGLGSPAYDDSNKYVVVSANALDCGTAGHPSQTFCVGPFGLLAVYDGTRDTGGTLVCMSGGYSGPLFTNSSPTVSNGVIYVGTDDGYVLAYDETSCTNGALNLIWTSPQMTLSGAPDPVSSPPVVSFNRIHVVTQSGTLYVYGLPGY